MDKGRVGRHGASKQRKAWARERRFSDVETTFGGDRYGAKGSVRTDVILRNEVGDVIAIYDVKTGEKGIEPERAAELRIKAGVGNEVPIMQMSFPYGISRKMLRKSFGVSTVLNYGH